jgi:hypothetical protein
MLERDPAPVKRRFRLLAISYQLLTFSRLTTHDSRLAVLPSCRLRPPPDFGMIERLVIAPVQVRADGLARGLVVWER